MKLKSQPSDFIVEEISNLNFNDSGKYCYYKLKKTNLDTLSAVQRIANEFKINKKYINIAGTKDKVAVTTQFISISKGPENGFKNEQINLEFLGHGNERLNLGMLKGNKFTIIVRDIAKKEMECFERNKDDAVFVNYYDGQRFGVKKNNHIVGRLIVKRDFEKAVKELLKSEHYPNNLIKKHIEKHKTDFIGALRSVPKRVLLMYVHAYQSYLWNKTAEKMNKEQQDVSLIGFDIEDRNDVIDEIMKEEEITERDFLIKEMPELCAAGGKRKLLMDVKDFKYEKLDDSAIKLEFSLGKGSYATMVVKILFSS
ncbi:hypothetical protein COV16_00995 [Candidatus Woesearchaeota archaeon CG10_big_fil_rev_8_21_14_0_10_34_8]|nr:MAG: hypothetical protein COV16_00995 [Candidatus Woesearchaeota archaeon CG10_big_fil_rev_8_21_14_0_10_34_8]